MSRLAIVTVMLTLGCGEIDYEFESRYTAVGTDVVDRVCEGTLANLDRDIEFIDDRLGFEHPDERIEVAIVDNVDAAAACGNHGVSCMEDDSVVLQAVKYEGARTHELVHARVYDSGKSGSVRLFLEGIAVALEPARCEPERELPSADAVLAVKNSLDLEDEGYYLGGELVAWLLETHGPQPVLAFMNELRRPDMATRTTEPDVVRTVYRQHFQSEFDDDLHAHLRDPASLTPAQLGCVAPAAPYENGQVRLQAELACDSDQVQNDFRVPGRGYVEWTLDVPETGIYRLLSDVPADTWLAIVRCTCDLYPLSLRWPTISWGEETHVGTNRQLVAGAYLVRWYGPYDRGAVLDVAIGVSVSPP